MYATSSCKRKLEVECEVTIKHTRLNGSEPEMLDVDMCATSSPIYAFPSPTSSNNSPVSYPNFELYPDASLMDCSPDSSAPSTPIDSPLNQAELDVRLLQPQQQNAFQHHGSCSQIPKLRVAQSPGLNGSRSLWSHCMQCGALEMVQC